MTALLQQHFKRGVHTVPGYISRWLGAGAGRDQASRAVLFVGSFGHRPNRVGLDWFINRVWPLLSKEAKLIVVGSNCPPELEQQLQDTEGVVFEGSVSDDRLAELYASTRISVAPLPYGAGLKGKVVEALSWGHRIIGSAYAFEGLDRDPFDAPALARRCRSTPAGFAAAIREGLAMHAAEAENLDKACKEFIERCFSAEAQQQAIKELLPPNLLPKSRTAQQVDEKASVTGHFQGATLMPTTRGLCHDQWLESENQLVLVLGENRRELRLGLYLPETGTLEGEAAVEIELGDGTQTYKQSRMTMQRGLNRASVSLPKGVDTLVTVTLRSFYRYLPEIQADQRQLIAVLSEVQALGENLGRN